MARVKVALLARLGKCETKTGRMVTRLQRRLAACLGDIDHLKSRLQLEALRKASQHFPGGLDL